MIEIPTIMDLWRGTDQRGTSRSEWRFTEKSLVVISFISLLILQNNHTVLSNETSQTNLTKILDTVDSNLDKQCHSCHNSSKLDSNDNEVSNDESENFIYEVISTVGTFTQKYLLVNKTEEQLESDVEGIIDRALSRDRIEIMDGVEIKSVEKKKSRTFKNGDDAESRALFSSYTYEYRLLQKIKNFVETHIISINLPKAARFITFRSFGLKKFFVPILLGAQLVKGMLVAMFLPSLLGSFGKIVGKAISQLSASSSQASNPPAMDDQIQYNDQKDFMGYETEPAGVYAYPQDTVYANMADSSDVNDLANVDMSRYGAGGPKVSYLPTKNGYYKNQLSSPTNNYKVFQKIPASSMILSNYDPFYSPLLSRLDGIFARLGLTPSENAIDTGAQIGGQTLSDVKLESCREQLICLMYANPAKYAPYSNLVSAQLSRELNELRRPVSDNPEILRFFRYMRAARRGQEGADCARAHPGCAAAAPAHTMIAAYHDINKLVSARKLKN